MALPSRGAERGQATVEMALLLPFVALLLGALLEIGLIAADQARLWHAAREAARIAAVDGEPANIEAAAEATGIGPLDVSVRPGPYLRRQGDPVTVAIDYHPPGRVPLLGVVFERVRLQATATMRIEQI